MSEQSFTVEEMCRQATEEARHDPRSTRELISLALASDCEEDAYWDIVRLLNNRATREVFEAGRALLPSACPAERQLGAAILGQLGCSERVFPEESLSALADLVARETDLGVLSSACYALGHLHHPATLRPLLSLRRHPSEDVRFAVAFGLAGNLDPKAVAALIELSDDSDSDVRDWATFGLGTQLDLDTPALRDALARRLTDSDGPTCGEALVGLARRGDERVVPALLEVLQSEDLDTKFAIRFDLVLEAICAAPNPCLLYSLLHLREQGCDEPMLDEAITRCQQ